MSLRQLTLRLRFSHSREYHSLTNFKLQADMLRAVGLWSGGSLFIVKFVIDAVGNDISDELRLSGSGFKKRKKFKDS